MTVDNQVAKYLISAATIVVDIGTRRIAINGIELPVMATHRGSHSVFDQGDGVLTLDAVLFAGRVEFHRDGEPLTAYTSTERPPFAGGGGQSQSSVGNGTPGAAGGGGVRPPGASAPIEAIREFGDHGGIGHLAEGGGDTPDSQDSVSVSRGVRSTGMAESPARPVGTLPAADLDPSSYGRAVSFRMNGYDVHGLLDSVERATDAAGNTTVMIGLRSRDDGPVAGYRLPGRTPVDLMPKMPKNVTTTDRAEERA